MGELDAPTVLVCLHGHVERLNVVELTVKAVCEAIERRFDLRGAGRYQLTELEAENVEVCNDEHVQRLARAKRTLQVQLADDTLEDLERRMLQLRSLQWGFFQEQLASLRSSQSQMCAEVQQLRGSCVQSSQQTAEISEVLARERELRLLAEQALAQMQSEQSEREVQGKLFWEQGQQALDEIRNAKHERDRQDEALRDQVLEEVQEIKKERQAKTEQDFNDRLQRKRVEEALEEIHKERRIRGERERSERVLRERAEQALEEIQKFQNERNSRSQGESSERLLQERAAQAFDEIQKERGERQAAEAKMQKEIISVHSFSQQVAEELEAQLDRTQARLSRYADAEAEIRKELEDLQAEILQSKRSVKGHASQDSLGGSLDVTLLSQEVIEKASLDSFSIQTAYSETQSLSSSRKGDPQTSLADLSSSHARDRWEDPMGPSNKSAFRMQAYLSSSHAGDGREDPMGPPQQSATTFITSPSPSQLQPSTLVQDEDGNISMLSRVCDSCSNRLSSSSSSPANLPVVTLQGNTHVVPDRDRTQPTMAGSRRPRSAGSVRGSRQKQLSTGARPLSASWLRSASAAQLDAHAASTPALANVSTLRVTKSVLYEVDKSVVYE